MFPKLLAVAKTTYRLGPSAEAATMWFAHLNHRLVQRCLRLLRSEVWAPTDRQKIHRVTARIVPRGLLRAPAVLVHARLTAVSSDSLRLHEELISAGGIIQEGRLERWNVTQTDEYLALGTNTEPLESIRLRLQALWPQLSRPLMAAVDARGKERTESIRKQLAGRADDEINQDFPLTCFRDRRFSGPLGMPDGRASYYEKDCRETRKSLVSVVPQRILKRYHQRGTRSGPPQGFKGLNRPAQNSDYEWRNLK
jgi:hypothetical protein